MPQLLPSSKHAHRGSTRGRTNLPFLAPRPRTSLLRPHARGLTLAMAQPRDSDTVRAARLPFKLDILFWYLRVAVRYQTMARHLS